MDIKKYIAVVAAAVVLLSCAEKPRLRPGDLIFVGIPMDYSIDDDTMGSAISASTGKGALNLIHVAIADVRADSVFIIDATLLHGVDRHPERRIAARLPGQAPPQGRRGARVHRTCPGLLRRTLRHPLHRRKRRPLLLGTGAGQLPRPLGRTAFRASPDELER